MNSSDFDTRLAWALKVPVPDDLVEALLRLPAEHPRSPASRPLRRVALAASVLLAVSVAVLVWRADRGYASIEDYVAEHYHHDGALVLTRGADQTGYDVESLLAGFGLTMEPGAADQVGYMMRCPTPAGVGLHFMLHTEVGPVTVIVMPATPVRDGMRFGFDGMQAELVALESGSAAVIARADQDIAFMPGFIRQSVRPRPISS